MRVGDVGDVEWELKPRRPESLIGHASDALGHPPRSIIAQHTPSLLGPVSRQSHHAVFLSLPAQRALAVAEIALKYATK
jgi:hypothetical protein